MALYTDIHNCKLEELGMIDLNPINILMMIGKIKNIVTLTTTYYKPVGEENPCVWCGYIPLIIF